MQVSYVKKLHEKLIWLFFGITQLSHHLCHFFLSILCVFLCVWLWWIQTRFLVCCLLATSAIMLSEKKKIKCKMCSKKWHLKSNISCDAPPLNELLETDVPWDDAIVVWAGKLRKLWDSLSELRSSLRERRLEITVLRPALLSVKTAQFTHFFRQVWRHRVKIAQFNWVCIWRLTLNLPTTTIVAQPFNVIKWQLKFNPVG